VSNEKNNSYRSWFNKAVVVICFLISTIMGYNYICDAQRATEAKEARAKICDTHVHEVARIKDKIEEVSKEATRKVEKIQADIKEDFKIMNEHQREDMKEIKKLIRKGNNR